MYGAYQFKSLIFARSNYFYISLSQGGIIFRFRSPAAKLFSAFAQLASLLFAFSLSLLHVRLFQADQHR
jgi:hypothetical protein